LVELRDGEEDGGRVKWAGLKSVDRAVEKVVRVYKQVGEWPVMCPARSSLSFVVINDI
jgi:hypothetical protein